MYVSMTIFGAPGDPSTLSPERRGQIAGIMFRAAEEASALDPYGMARWSFKRGVTLGQSKRPGRPFVAHTVEWYASHDDVLAGGPIHRERADRCRAAMYAVLEAEMRRPDGS